jgi:protein-disulfide isomerase
MMVKLLRLAVLLGALALVGCAPALLPSATPTPAPRPTLAAPTAVPTPTVRPRAIPGRTADGVYFVGSLDAPVTLDQYADFQCPACGEFARAIEPQLRTAYLVNGRVRLVWHDFPWIGSESFIAAQAGRCAGDQGGFWAYHDYLYAHQRGENLGQFAPDNLKTFAVEIGLDGPSFDACLDSGRDLPSIRDDVTRALDRGVTVTPYFFINGQPRVGAPSTARFAALLDAALGQADH